MLIKSEQLSVGSLIKNVMLKYLFWASYILRLCAQTCTPNRHALDCFRMQSARTIETTQNKTFREL